MPMRGENRALVSDGIARMNAAPRPCIAALLATSGAADKPVSATNLSFSVIPRLNAAGRMGDAQLALDLLMTDDLSEAQRLASRLEAVNDQRRAIEAELSEIAKAQAADVYHGQRALVVAGEGWHEGVKGIVASRLVNAYGVPSLLFTIDGDEARGSGRSVGQVNLFKAVESASDLLTRFGGHEAAVGVTLPAENLPEFERRLAAYLDELPEGAFHPLVNIDACVELDELTLESVAQLDALAPFGQEIPVPVLPGARRDAGELRARWAPRRTTSRARSPDGRATVSGIMFHCSDIEALMRTDSVVNAAFEVQIDEWRGRAAVKAMLQSLAPARACGGLEACLNPENLSFVADLYATSDAELVADAPHDPDDVEAYEALREQNRAAWEARQPKTPRGLKTAVVRAIIGDRPLHEAQRAVLDHLRQGGRCSASWPRGAASRSRSRCTPPCARLRAHEASLFVYPLRALIADQAFHLREALAAFGMRVTVLTGESTPEERRQAFAGLADGAYDIALTTPEFLAWHAEEFAAARARAVRGGGRGASHRHGAGGAASGLRGHRRGLGEARRRPRRRFRRFRRRLRAACGAGPHGHGATTRRPPPSSASCRWTPACSTTPARPNLEVDDQRNLRNRDDYLANLVATGEKTVVYVNSREQSVTVARALRKRVPQLAPLIGFYNAGLSRSERKRIEELFRTDALRCWWPRPRSARAWTSPTSATWCCTTCRSTR